MTIQGQIGIRKRFYMAQSKRVIILQINVFAEKDFSNENQPKTILLITIEIS